MISALHPTPDAHSCFSYHPQPLEILVKTLSSPLSFSLRILSPARNNELLIHRISQRNTCYFTSRPFMPPQVEASITDSELISLLKPLWVHFESLSSNTFVGLPFFTLEPPSSSSRVPNSNSSLAFALDQFPALHPNPQTCTQLNTLAACE